MPIAWTRIWRVWSGLAPDRMARELAAQVLKIDLRELIHGRPLLDAFMRRPLVDGEEGLAHDRGIGVVHLAEEQVAAQVGVWILREHSVDEQHLAKGRGGLGKVLKVEQVRNGYSPYWMSYGGDAFFSLKPTEAEEPSGALSPHSAG